MRPLIEDLFFNLKILISFFRENNFTFTSSGNTCLLLLLLNRLSP